jgi:hypothetical protein
MFFYVIATEERDVGKYMTVSADSNTEKKENIIKIRESARYVMAIVIVEIPEKVLILKMNETLVQLFLELGDCSLLNNRMVALYTLK